MSIRTKIDFSGITSDNIVTSDNKKYIHEDDEIFNSLKDEIAACENAQAQTEIATLQILEIKEQTKVIANEAIDTATERAETAAQNAETAQALAETAALNALESERNVTELIQGNIGDLPIGTIIPFGGSSIPDGYLSCDGSKVSRTTYSKLFQAIGTRWGAGDGSTTFALPNLTGRFIEGHTTAGTYKDAGLPNIKGDLYPLTSDNEAYFHTSSTTSGAFYKISTGSDNTTVQNTGGTYSGFALGFDASKSNAIYGKSSTVQPKSATVLYIIKYQ